MPELAGAAVAVRGVLAAAAARLQAAGCDSPRLDAELLLGSVLGVPRARLVIDGERGLEPPPLERFEALIDRRAAREPVAYILGERAFRHLSLAVDRRALIPRPETELLVEVGLGLPCGAAVLDVGTGSGAIALALKQERPDLALTGTDVSAAAITLARENAAGLGLDVEFVCGDLLAGRSADAVLANLPYVEAAAPLAPEIAAYEPPGALFAGADGLDQIRRLVAGTGPGISLLALEIGSRQGAAVRSLLAGAGFATVRVVRDLSGFDRVVVGAR